VYSLSSQRVENGLKIDTAYSTLLMHSHNSIVFLSCEIVTGNYVTDIFLFKKAVVVIWQTAF